jgi:hypothetical protein
MMYDEGEKKEKNAGRCNQPQKITSSIRIGLPNPTFKKVPNATSVELW